MLFVSATFLFLYLPLVLVVYYGVRIRNIQNGILFFVSIFFYAWGEPVFSLVLLLSIVFNWLIALGIAKYSKFENVKKSLLIIACIFNVGLLFTYKYLDFFTSQINHLLGINIPLKNIALPIGISFFTFQALSYVIDVYNGEQYQNNPIHVGLYISFFPQLIAGPIVRYNPVKEQIIHRVESVGKFQTGVVRFMEGFSKKVLLANTMGFIADKAFSLLGTNLTTSFAWLGAIAYTLQIYFDFSGYSDMAIGLGKMFGFEFEENFRAPYVSKTITEFWRRWHISLSSWFRDYVYIPLGGNRTGNSIRNYTNLFVVWLLTGIWHGANWTFILWGLLYFVFLVLEKATPLKYVLENHKVLGHLYTLIVVCILWVIFRASSVSEATAYIKVMLGKTGQLSDGRTLVYLRENALYLVMAVLLSSDIPAKMKGVYGNNKLICWLSELVLMLIFGISVIYMVNGTYNPFIYFNF